MIMDMCHAGWEISVRPLLCNRALDLCMLPAHKVGIWLLVR